MVEGFVLLVMIQAGREVVGEADGITLCCPLTLANEARGHLRGELLGGCA